MQVGDYVIKPSSKSNEEMLFEFLEFNNFSHDHNFENNPLNREYVIVVNVIKRTYFIIDKFFLAADAISEIEFLSQINYFPEKEIEYEKLYNDELVPIELDSPLDDFISKLAEEGFDGMYMSKVKSLYNSVCFDELLITIFASSRSPVEIFERWFRNNNDVLGQKAFAYECANTMIICELI